MFLAVCRRFTSRKTRVVAPEMLGLTCRVGAHISCYAHDTRLYPGYGLLENAPIDFLSTPDPGQTLEYLYRIL